MRHRAQVFAGRICSVRKGDSNLFERWLCTECHLVGVPVSRLRVSGNASTRLGPKDTTSCLQLAAGKIRKRTPEEEAEEEALSKMTVSERLAHIKGEPLQPDHTPWKSMTPSCAVHNAVGVVWLVASMTAPGPMDLRSQGGGVQASMAKGAA